LHEEVHLHPHVVQHHCDAEVERPDPERSRSGPGGELLDFLVGRLGPAASSVPSDSTSRLSPIHPDFVVDIQICDERLWTLSSLISREPHRRRDDPLVRDTVSTALYIAYSCSRATCSSSRSRNRLNPLVPPS
jgi:hypothetical protein